MEGIKFTTFNQIGEEVEHKSFNDMLKHIEMNADVWKIILFLPDEGKEIIIMRAGRNLWVLND